MYIVEMSDLCTNAHNDTDRNIDMTENAVNIKEKVASIANLDIMLSKVDAFSCNRTSMIRTTRITSKLVVTGQ